MMMGGLVSVSLVCGLAVNGGLFCSERCVWWLLLRLMGVFLFLSFCGWILYVVASCFVCWVVVF